MAFDLATAKPVGASGGKFDLSTAKPVAAPDVPQFERDAAETLASTPAERIAANPIVRTMTSAAAPVMGGAALLERPFGGHAVTDLNSQLAGMQERGAKALNIGEGSKAASDVAGTFLGPLGLAMKVPAGATALERILQGSGAGGLAGVTQPSDSTAQALKQGAEGVAAGGVLSSILEAPFIGPAVKSLVKSFGGKSAETPPVGKGAEKVTGELQRQRGVMEKTGEPRVNDPNLRGPQQPASEYERMATDFENTMRPLRDKAFVDKGVDASKALDLIRGLEAKNPDKTVRSALAEVKDTIGRAAKGQQAASMPAAGSRMTPSQLKALQGQGNSLDVPMLDEVRQSINRMIEGKGEKALSKHTQDVLSQVRDRLLADAPQSYRDYLKQYAEGKAKFDRFDPTESVFGKVTSGAREFRKLEGVEAQKAIEKAFEGPRLNRDLKDLVDATKHDPAATTGLQGAFKDWLFQPNQTGRIDPATTGKHWQESRDAIRDSGMFTPEHFKALDSVVNDLSKRSTRAAQTVGGWLVGWTYGRPGSTAMVTRKMGDLLSNRPQDVDALMQKALTDPRLAAQLSASPTMKNIGAIERAMGITAGQATDEPPRPKRDPLAVTLGRP